MKKIILALMILLIFASSSSAQPLMNGLGFAFQNKDFKTVKMALFQEETASNTANTANTTEKNAQKKLSGLFVIAGYEYVLKVTMFETINLEADLFESSAKAWVTGNSEQQKKEELPVPLGHVSLTLSQPDPTSSVITGSLRLNDEQVSSVSGEFDLYLNDITRKNKKADLKQKSLK